MRTRIVFKLYFCSIFTLLLFFSSLSFARVRYMRPGGTGDGSSWAQSSGNFQNMMNLSVSGDEIWIAEGVYESTATFVGKDGVKVYGGFSATGTPTAVTQAKPQSRFSVLMMTANNLVAQLRSGNQYWYGVTLTIKEGLASPYESIQLAANAHLDYCRIIDNRSNGSTMLWMHNNSKITNSLIANNRGAKLIMINTAASLFENSIIVNNTANRFMWYELSNFNVIGFVGSIIANNSFTSFTNGYYDYNVYYYNTIIWGNPYGGLYRFFYCGISAGYNSGRVRNPTVLSPNNDDPTGPQFYNPTQTRGVIADRMSEDYAKVNNFSSWRVKPTSILLKRGTETITAPRLYNIAEFDILGEERKNDCGVDIGPYAFNSIEYKASAVITYSPASRSVCETGAPIPISGVSVNVTPYFNYNTIYKKGVVTLSGPPSAPGDYLVVRQIIDPNDCFQGESTPQPYTILPKPVMSVTGEGGGVNTCCHFATEMGTQIPNTNNGIKIDISPSPADVSNINWTFAKNENRITMTPFPATVTTTAASPSYTLQPTITKSVGGRLMSTITATANAGMCAPNLRKTFDVYVYDQPTVKIVNNLGDASLPQYVCPNSSMTLKATLVGGDVMYDFGTTRASYAWYKSTDGIFPDGMLPIGTSQTYTIPAITADKEYYQCIITYDNGRTKRNSITLTKRTIPVIQSTSPSGSLTVGYGSPVDLQVTATSSTLNIGDQLLYQWQQSATSGGPFTDIAGAYAATYRVPSLTSRTYYRVKVSSPGNCPTDLFVYSPEIDLNVGIEINTQPVSADICAGESHQLTVTATGQNPLCVWEYTNNVNDATSWRDVGPGTATVTGGQITSNLIINPELNRNHYYRVRIDAESQPTTHTNVVEIKVVSPPVITLQPVGGSGCAGQNFPLSIQTQPSIIPVTYQWQQLNGTNWGNIAGATNATYIPTVPTNATVNKYRCYVTVPSCPSSVFSNEVSVSMSNAPTITRNLNIREEFCRGTSLPLSVEVAGAPVTYQWQRRVASLWSNLQGANASTYTISDDSQLGVYRCVITPTSCGGALTSNICEVTQGTAPRIIAEPVDGTACVTSNYYRLSLQAEGNDITYTWYKQGATGWNGLANTAVNYYDIYNNIDGTYRCQVVNGCGTATSRDFIITLSDLPTILSHPANIQVCSGQSTIVSVTASGSLIMNYQWQESVDGITYNDIAGAQSARYTVNNVTSAKFYRCKVTACGGTVTSQPALVSVGSAPIIRTQPLSGSVCGTGSYVLRIVAEGAMPLTYQWQREVAGVWTNIDAQNSTQLQIAGITSTTNYRCIVTGCGSVTSNVATVQVDTRPLIQVQPQNKVVCPNTSTTLNVTAIGLLSPTYKWEISTNGNTWLPTGTNNAQLVTSQVNVTTYYKVTISGTDLSCGSTTSNTVSVTPSGMVNITRQPTSGSFCEGGSHLLSIAVDMSDVTYQWSLNGVDIAGATASTYAATQEGDYRCVVKNTCEQQVTSSIATVTRTNQPNIVTQPQSGAICSGEILSLSVVATGSIVLNYQWSSSLNGDVWTNVSAGNGGTSPALNIPWSQGLPTLYKCEISSPTCGMITTSVATVSPGASPRILTNPQGGTVCRGSSHIFNVATTDGGTKQYQWQKFVSPGNYTDISGATASTYAIYNITENITVRCKVYNNCGATYSSDAQLTVTASPTIAVQPKSARICPGETHELSATVNGISLANYSWQESVNGGPWTTVGTSSTYSVTQPDNNKRYKVIITPMVAGCATIESAAATVQLGTTSPATLPATGAICTGGRFDLEITDGGSDYATYQWLKDGSIIPGATLKTYAATETNTYHCRVTNGCGSIDVGPTVITTTDRPLITRQPVGGLDCGGNGFTLSVNATGAQPIKYQWKLDGVNIPNANTNTYEITGISREGAYSVDVEGCGTTVGSDVVTVKPSTRPVIDVQPTDGTYCSGSVFTTTVLLRGNPDDYTYQWMKQQPDRTWSNVEGSISATISIGEVGRYRCVINNDCGTVTSNEIYVRLGSVPSILNTPQSVSLCQGETTTFTINATGSTAYTYQWRSSIDGTNWSNITDATTESYVATHNNMPTMYQCLVGAEGCLSKATSPRFTVSQGNLPEIITQPVGGSRCASTDVELSVGALPASSTYQWRYSSTLTGTYLPEGTTSTYVARQNGFYKVEVTNGCGTATSNTVEITTGEGFIVAQPQSVRLCPGNSGEMSVTVAGISTPTYQWQKLNNRGTWDNVGNNSSVLSLSYSNVPASYKVVISGCGAPLESQVVNYSPGYQPVISVQPQGGSVCIGGTYPLSVTATGSDNISYLWQVQNGADWIDIPSSNTSAYTLNNMTLSSTYRVKAMNNCGEVTSDRATVSISSSPVIVQQPQDISSCNGSSVTLSVGVRGSGLETYQWEGSSDGYTFAPIPNATSSNYITNSTETLTKFYQCKITGNSATCGSVTSDVAEVRISNEPIVITRQPVGGMVCPGGSFTVSVEATGPGTLSYQWMNGSTPISLATSSSYTISGVTTDQSLHCVISSSCATQIFSTVAVIRSGNFPTIVTQPLANVAVCSGDNYQLSVEATGGSLLSYQWQRYSSDGTWLDVSGQNTSILRLNDITTAVAYRVIVGSLGCTQTVISDISNVTRGGIPVITQQPIDGSISICEGGGVYRSTVAAEGATLLHYQWQEKVDGRWTNIMNANNSVYNITKEGVYQVKISNGCGTNYTNIFTVEAKGLSIITQPTDAEVCGVANATFTVLATGARVLQYQWQEKLPTDGSTFLDIPGATSSTYTATTPTLGTQYRVNVTTTNPTCPGITSYVATVMAAGTPVITNQPVGGTFCGDASMRLSVTVTGSNSHSYQWHLDTGTGHNPIPGATSSSVLVNAAGKYKCYISYCLSGFDSDEVTVSRGTSPTITQSPVQETTICLGETLTLSAEVTGASLINYQWYKVVGTENILIPSAQNKSYILSPTEAGTTSYFLRADATPSGCGVLDTRVTNVVVRPKTKIKVEPVSGSMCQDQTYVLSTAIEPAEAFHSVKWYMKDPANIIASDWQELSGETELQLRLSGFVTRQNYKAVISTDCGDLTTREVSVWTSTSPTVVSHPQSAQLCQNIEYSMKVSVAGVDNPLYQWQYLDGTNWTNIAEEGNDSELFILMPSNTRVYRCAISSDSENCESVVSNTATLQLGTLPTIISQAPNGTALPKGEYSLFINAQGSSDMTYQWQKYNGTAWEDVNGATNNTYTAKNLPDVLGETVLYRCVLYNTCGSLVEGPQILITIGNQLTIIEHPKSYTICDGDNAVLQAKATGSSDVLYQWEYSTDRVTWSNVSIGGENPLLNVNDIEQLTYYRCKISSIKLGTGYFLYTNEAQVGIGRVPIILQQPVGGYMCPNGTFDMSFTVSEIGSRYQWQYKDGGIWVDISNANQLNYTIDNLATTTVYRGVAANGCGTVNTNSITVQIANQPTIIQHPKSVVACASERVTLFAQLTGGTRYTYAWENSADGENWTPIQGANQREYITSPTADPLFYRVNVTSEGCGTVVSKPAKVSNFSGITIETQPKGGTSCLNGKFILYTMAKGSENITYQWQKKVGEGRWENIRGAQAYSVEEIITETTHYRCLLSTICLPDPIRTNEVTVSVADAPTILEQPQGAMLCSESHTMVFVVAGSSAFTYQWESSGDGRIWNSIEGATQPTYTVVGNHQTTMYRVSATPNEQTCGIVMSDIVTVEKGFEPLVTLPSAVSVCKNSSYTLQPEVEGSSTATYLWQQFVGGVWKSIEGEASQQLELSYINEPSSYRLKVTNGCGTNVSNTARVSIGTTPTIVKSPKSITVCEGQGTTLNVEATGALLLNYQWQKSIDDGLNWSSIDGAATTMLDINPVEEPALYRCIVSGLTSNCGTVNSEPATVSIQQPDQIIAILEQPTSGTVCSGNDYKLTVVPDGFMTFSYQWQISFDNDVFEDIEGAVSSTYVVKNVTDDAYYRCVLQSCGITLESTSAYVQVAEQPTIIIHPKSGTICAEESYPLRVEVTGINLPNYQWKYSTNMQDWNNIDKATNNVYVANFTQDKLYFQCEIQQGVCGPVTSATAVVNKVNNIIITQQPVGGTMCENSTFKLYTQSNIPNAVYQWQEKFGDWFDIAGANTHEYDLPFFGKGSREIRCLVSVLDGRCQSKLTNSITVSSSNIPSFIVQPKDQQVCLGQTVTLQAEATGSLSVNYQWQKTTDGQTWADVADAVDGTLSVVVDQLPQAYRCIVPKSGENCQQAISQVATCSFGGNPEIVKPLVGGTTCADAKFGLSIGVIGSDLKYTWEKSDDGLEWQALLTDTDKSTYDVMPGSAYRVIVKNACGEVTSNVVTVSSGNQPTIVAQPQSISLCDGENGQLSIAVTGANPILLQWQRFNNGTWSDIFGATQSTFSISRVEELTQYRCKITACSSTMYSESAFAKPGTIPTIITQPVGGAMCAGEKFVLDVTANQVDNVEYIWQYRHNSEWMNVNVPSEKQLTVSNLQRSTFYRVIVKNGCGADTSRSSVMVFNASIPSITKQQSDVIACPEEEIRLQITATGGNILNYQWQKYETQWVNVDNQVSPSLVINGWAHGDKYRCIVSGGTETCGSINSREILLAEGGVPQIVKEPLSGTMCPNGQYPLSVTTKEGQKVTYQWQYINVDGSGNISGSWVDIFGATSSTYNVVAGLGIRYYRVLITNGCGMTISQEVMVAESNIPTLVVSPQNATICNGAEHTLLAEVAGSKNFSYQWQSSVDGVVWLDMLGANLPVYKFKPNVTSNYRFVAVPAEDNCYSVITTKVKVDVLPGATIIEQPKDLVVSCLSYDAQLAVGLESSDNITYRWQQLNGETWKDLNDAAYSEAVYQGTTTDTLAVLGTSVMGSFEYRVSLVNTTNNCIIHSEPVLLLVVPSTTVSITPLENTMNRPEDQVILNSILSGGAAEISYQWLAGTSPEGVSPIADNTPKGASYLDITGETLQFTGIETTKKLYYKLKISAPNCPDAYSNAVTVSLAAQHINVVGAQVITPNGDGLNDVLKHPFYGTESVELRIMNRSGNLVYESKNYDETFSAAGLPQGVYFYSYKVNYEDGRVEHFQGTITVVM